MKKQSTSRWREAVRSGEVSPQAGQRVMKSLGYTPQEWARRLGQGAARLAESQGYTVERNPKFTSRMQGMTEIPTKKITIGTTPLENARQAQTLHHEAREAQESARLLKQIRTAGGRVSLEKGVGYVKIPPEIRRVLKPIVGTAGGIVEKLSPSIATDLRQEVFDRLAIGESPLVSNLYTTSHTNPTLPINDIRESRLLPEYARKEMEKMRNVTGESLDMATAAGHPETPINKLRLPRHQVRSMAQRIRQNQINEALEIANAEIPIPRVLRRVSSYLKRFLKR